MDERLSDADLERLIKGASADNHSSEAPPEEKEKKGRTADKLIKSQSRSPTARAAVLRRWAACFTPPAGLRMPT